MFEKGVCMSVLYCLCFKNEKSTDMLEDQLREEGNHDLELEDELFIV